MDLRCPECGSTYADRWRCRCGAPLSFAERPLPSVVDPDEASIDPCEGLWTFADFLPTNQHASLGEGYSPLVDAPAWDASFKLEYVFPTGSFKDRGATTTLSRAVELGIDRVVEDSSGNAGAAIATYAARANVSAEIFVPADVSRSKVRAIERAGAEVVRVPGSREDVTAACIERVEAGAGWYASHAWNPAFFAGTETMAYEITHQRDWNAPDAVVAPLGHGTMFLGAYRGFRALKAAGWIDEVPRMLGAQAAGYDPIASELHGEIDGPENELADGIRIREPVRKDEILAAIEATNGDAIAVSGAAVERELERLHAAGFYVEPTSAIAPAALSIYRIRGDVDGTDIVVPLSGSGLKS